MIYDVRYATVEDINLIIEFIDKHWKRNHALVLSKKLLDFQHLNPITNSYNFILAENKETKEIDALLGFIPTYQYDINLYQEGDVWGAIWKVRRDVENAEIKELAVFLWEMYFNIPDSKTYAGIGLSSDAIKIYRATRNYVGVLNQYFIINENKSAFVIAKIDKSFVGSLRKINRVDNSKNAYIDDNLDISGIDDDAVECSYKPKKTIVYLRNRYLLHPIYKYSFWGIYLEEKLVSVWVIRIVNINGSHAIRVVDIYGNIECMPSLYDCFQRILLKYDAEYIDLLNFGISENVFKRIGFHKLDFSGPYVIPNYFEPFVRENIKLYFTYKSKQAYTIFKGDADQDRPNII